MVTMANNKTLEALNLKLEDARRNLERAEREQAKVEEEISGIQTRITALLVKLETEALPTGLYNKGYKLQEIEHKIILSNRYDEEVSSFNYVPTLSDLMEIEHSVLVEADNG